MGAVYDIWLCDNRGRHLAPITDYTRLLYTRAVSGVGMLDLALPPTWQERINRLMPDGIIQVSRALPGRAAHDTLAYFLTWDEYASERGTYRVGGYDLGYLLSSRITTGTKNGDGCTDTDSADDVMKYYARWHLGASATDTARDLSAYGLTIEGDNALGVSIAKAACRRPLEDVLGELVESSIGDGTPCFWGFTITATNPLAFTLSVRKTQWGLDRTQGAKSPLLLSEEAGNLRAVKLRRDYTDEITYVYAAGAGEGADRVTTYVTDAVRAGKSPWRRREALYSNPQLTTAAALQDAASAVLQAGAPRVTFEGEIAETPQCRYGRDWNLGYAMTARVQGYSFNVRADKLRVTATRKRERIECQLKGVSVATVTGEAA